MGVPYNPAAITSDSPTKDVIVDVSAKVVGNKTIKPINTIIKGIKGGTTKFDILLDAATDIASDSIEKGLKESTLEED